MFRYGYSVSEREVKMYQMFTKHRLNVIVLTMTIIGIAGLNPIWLHGQASANASIVGKVTDENGAVIPNAQITVTSPQLQVQQVTTTSDVEGNYKILELPAPGVYRITFVLTGFQTFRQEGLNLSVGFAARVDAVMKIGAVSETVSVTGASPVVDTVSTAGETTLEQAVLDSAPRGENVQELIPLVTGMNLTGTPDVGDSQMASRAAKITYGVPLQATLAVEGIDTNEDKTQSTTAYLDSFSIGEAEFKTVGNNADVAFAGMDQVLVMKSGSNSFHGQARGDYENPSWQFNNVTKTLAGPPSNLKESSPITSPGYYDYAADVGGRIIRDKLWFYGGFSRQYVNQFTIGVVGAPGASCPAASAWLAADCSSVKLAPIWNGLPEENVKVDYQMTPAIKWIFADMHSNKNADTQPGFSAAPLASTTPEVNPGGAWKGEVQIVHAKWVFDGLGGFGGSAPTYSAQSASNIAQYGFTKGTGFAGDPSELDKLTNLPTGTNSEPALLHNFWRHEAEATFGYLPTRRFLGGTHQLKVGTTLTWEEGDAGDTREYPSGDYELIFNSPNLSATTPNPYEITVYNYPVLPKNLLHNQGYFVTDTWSLKHLSLNLGVRVERYNAYYPSQKTTAGQFADLFPATTLPNTNILTWVDVVPRAGAAWDVMGNGKTVVKGSFGEFGDTMGYLYAGEFNPESVESKTYSWTVTQPVVYGTGANQCQQTATLAPVEYPCDVTPAYLALLPTMTPISQTGGSSQVNNKSLKQDKTFEYVLGLERQLMPNVALKVGFVRLALYNLYDSETNGGSLAATVSYNGTGIAVGHPYSSYTLPADFSYTFQGATKSVTLYTYPTGSGTTSNEFLNTPSNRPDVYDSYEVTVTKQFSTKWDAIGSFWTTKNHRWLQGLAQIAGSPNDDPYAIDNTWNWNISGDVTYRLPASFNVSGTFRAQSGTYGQLTSNFSGTGTNGQALNQGTVTMRLGPYGQFQGPIVEVLDFKAAKDFKWKESRVFEVNTQIFNVMNSSAAVTTSYLLSKFGTVTNIVSGRVFRIGGQFSF